MAYIDRMITREEFKFEIFRIPADGIGSLIPQFEVQQQLLNND